MQIDRLSELAVYQGDYCYFPAFYFEPNARYDHKDPRAVMPQGLQGGEISGRLGEGLARFYRATGYEPARELAIKLTRYMRFHDGYYASDGEFLAQKHFHGGTIYLLNMLEVATATGDRELLDFVRRSFEWAKSPKAGGSALTGFMPEFAKPYRTSEGCAVADMLSLAIKLSACGAGDYYEDAERWARNHFAEMQLTPSKADQLVHVGQTLPKKKLLSNETGDRVAERNVGAFSGWCLGNEWCGPDEGLADNLIMHCCTGNDRAVYYLYDHIVDCKDGQLRIHMLLNRAAAWADIYSSIPYEGRVDIRMKKSCAGRSGSRAGMDRGGERPDCRSRGRSPAKLRLGRPLSGSWPGRGRAEDRRPISHRHENGQRQAGSDGLHVDHQREHGGRHRSARQNCPLYQRRLPKRPAPSRQVTRFVADQRIDW